MTAAGAILESASPLWVPPVTALCVGGLILLMRRAVRVAQNLCLLVALVAAVEITGSHHAPGPGLPNHGWPVIMRLPAAIFGVPTAWSLPAPSVTIIIFVLIAFLFSLSWLVTARPGSKSLFWLVLEFAFIWGIATATDLPTIFVCAQLLVVPQYCLNLGAGPAHCRRIARRMLVSSMAISGCILAAMVVSYPPPSATMPTAGGAVPSIALAFIMLAIWLSLSLFPFHSLQNARMTIDGQNLLPLNSNLWTGLALMLWLEHSTLVTPMHLAAPWLAVLGGVAMAACSVACFAQRELSRSMAYAAGAISAFAFLAWLAQGMLGVVGAVLILGVLPVTIFGFQRGIDLLFLQARDLTVLSDSPATSRGATHLLFLLLTAACVGMPATAVFRGVWFALVGIILTTTSTGHINWQTVFLGFFAFSALMPMILGVISRSLLAFRDPAQNIRRPDINVYAVSAGTGPDASFTAPLNLDAYIRTARRWAIWAMLVSLTLGIFPTLAVGPLLNSLSPPRTQAVPLPTKSPRFRQPPTVIVEWMPSGGRPWSANGIIGGNYP